MGNALRRDAAGQERIRVADLERLFQRVAAGVMLTSLSACGGGGGADWSYRAPAPPPPPPIPAVLSVPAPTGYDADKLAAFNRLNALRLQAGLGMLASDPRLDQAAQAHADWMVANNTYSHVETPGTPGFTGEYDTDREGAAGYAGSGGGEVMAAGVPTDVAVDELVNVVYHRELTLSIFPVDLGIGYSSSTSAVAIPQPLVIDFSTPAYGSERTGGQLAQAANGGVVIWPIDGASGVAVDMGPEFPNPVPDRDVNSLGMPVSIATRAGDRINVSSFELNDVDASQVVPVSLLTRETDPNFEIFSEYAAIVPLQHLRPSTHYRVDFVGSKTDSAGTTPLTKTWSFSTAP